MAEALQEQNTALGATIDKHHQAANESAALLEQVKRELEEKDNELREVLERPVCRVCELKQRMAIEEKELAAFKQRSQESSHMQKQVFAQAQESVFRVPVQPVVQLVQPENNCGRGGEEQDMTHKAQQRLGDFNLEFGETATATAVAALGSAGASNPENLISFELSQIGAELSNFNFDLDLGGPLGEAYPNELQW